MSVCEQGRQRANALSCLRPVALAVACAVVPVISALAADLDEVVVSATRSEQRLTDVLADVTVIDRQVIERSGVLAIEDVLSQVPGVQITRNGGPGTEANIMLRGAYKQHTAVYVDGIRIDGQSTSGGAPLEALPIDLIERVEVLRGAASAVYGSDAMAGAIQIFTKRGQTGFSPSVSLGVGSNNTRKASAQLSGGQGQWDYALGMAYSESDSFDSKTNSGHNRDTDDYLRKSANLRLGLQINDVHRVDVTALTSDSNAGYDSRKVGNDRGVRTLDAQGMSWEGRWSPEVVSRLSVNQSRHVYETRNPKPSGSTTKLRNYLQSNEWKSTWGTFSAGVEHRSDQFESSALLGAKEKSRQQNGVTLGWGHQWGAHALQTGLRYDKDSDFGGQTSYSAAYGWTFAPQWKATASMGSGFRVPTLYQRFSTYGSSDLQPETSRNTELGVQWQQADRGVSLTAYRNRIDNILLIQDGQGDCIKNGSDYCYANIDQAVLEGITLAGHARTGRVAWTVSLDWQNPHDASNGHLLHRRSKRYANIGAQTQWQGWMLGSEVQAASRRYNKLEDKEMTLGGYTLVNLSASKLLSPSLTLQARIDNVFDRDYTLAKDYATPGRHFYIGMKWAPK